MAKIFNWIIFFAALLVGGCVVAFIKYPPTNSGEWSGWVQAFGSIAAIGGTAYIGERQRKAAVDAVTDAHLLAETGRRKSILAIAQAAASRADRFEAAVLSPEIGALGLIFSPVLIGSLSRAFAGVPIHEIGSSNAVQAFLEMSDQYVFLGKEIEKYLAGPANDPLHMELRKAYGDISNASVDSNIPGNYPSQVQNLVRGWREVRKKNICTYVEAIKDNYGILRAEIDPVRL